MFAFLRPLSGPAHTAELHGPRVYLRVPRAGDWRAWTEIRTASRAFLEPWEPTWSKGAVSRGAYRRRLRRQTREGRDDTGWRLRQFVKASWALPRASRLSLLGYDEVFVDLNDTDWGQNAGFAQNRFFAGIGFQLDADRRAVMEVGYLNQFIQGDPANEMNHILVLNLLLIPV